MSLFHRILTLLLIAAWGVLSPGVQTYALEISESSVATPEVTGQSFFSFVGLPQQVSDWFSHHFSYSVLLHNLQQINGVVTFVFVIFALALITILAAIFSYVQISGKKINLLHIVPEAIDSDPSGFFSQYCRRDDDGTYTCSYAKHKRFSRLGRMTFKGAFATFLLKLAIILIIVSFQYSYSQAFEGRTGTDYTIFIDSAVSGGGRLASATYDMDSSFGEPVAPVSTSSDSFEQRSGITSIGDEPSIGYTLDSTPINFGILSNDSTAYSSHEFTVYYNGTSGYDVVLQGTPPVTAAGDDIDPIGQTAASSVIGAEQYGINLAGNTIPTNLGSDPSGGAGQATTQYSQTNKYAYNPGDVIATSSAQSSTTTYTISIIMNISQNTPAGEYSSQLVYVVVPKF